MNAQQAGIRLGAGPSPLAQVIARSWILACAVAEFIGMGSGALLARAASPGGEASSALPAIGGGAVTGLIEGAALGVLQWRVLTTRFPGLAAPRWVGITTAAAVAGWTLGSLPATTSSQGGSKPPLLLTTVLAAGLGAGMGLLFGAAQWLVLRHHARDAHMWVVANIAGWAAAMPVIFAGASAPTAETPIAAVAAIGALTGAFAGAVLGAITAPWLVRLRPRRGVRRRSSGEGSGGSC